MRRDTGSPEPSIIIYAIARGEYDRDLTEIALAISRRRAQAERVGFIIASRGDIIEMFDDPPTPKVIRGIELEVVGYPRTGDPNRIRARLLHPVAKYPEGKIIVVKEEWIYRVHYRK